MNGPSADLYQWHLPGRMAQHIYPNLRLLRYGGIMPQYPDPDVINVVCPDNEKPVIFELRRLTVPERL